MMNAGLLAAGPVTKFSLIRVFFVAVFPRQQAWPPTGVVVLPLHNPVDFFR